MASDLRLGTVALGILEAGEGEMVEWGGVQGGGDKAGGNKSATIGTGDGVPADVVKGGHLVRAWGNLSLGRHAEALEEARKAGQMTEVMCRVGQWARWPSPFLGKPVSLHTKPFCGLQRLFCHPRTPRPVVCNAPFLSHQAPSPA